MSVPLLARINAHPRAARSAVTLFSLGFALVHAGPLNGSLIALVITIALQVYWPGAVLARALGRLRRGDHPLLALGWIMAAGLGLTIGLGGLARLIETPPVVYLFVLHGLLLGLGLLPAATAPAEAIPWRLTRRAVPGLAVLIVACAVGAAGGYERTRVRYSGFEDQTVFVSLANWLAHDPSDPGRLSVQLGNPGFDIRWATDGWTYTHAVWAWSSGRPPADLIWHDLTPLFAWTIPLIWAALAYALTGSESAAVWSAACVVIFGLLTVDDLVYIQGGGVFGQDGLFELNTLRKFSSGVVLPLALAVLVSLLHAPRRRDWLILLLIGVALAMLHPQQVAMFLVDAGAIGGLWWLAHPDRARLRRLIAVGAVLAGVMILPAIQWALDPIRTVNLTAEVNASFTAGPESAVPAAGVERTTTAAGVSVLSLSGLPLVGSTYILDPAVIVYHPLILLAIGLGLLHGLFWRRSFAANVLFAATIGPLAVVFVPGLAALFARFATLSTSERMAIAIPVAAILGISLDGVLTRLNRRGLAGGLAVLLAAAIVGLYLEPLPIAGSGRDQIRAAGEAEALRRMLPADQAAIEALADLVPALPGDAVVLMNGRASNYVIESVPHALITGGRQSGNLLYPQTARFFNEAIPLAPWLDSADLDFLRETGATHIIAEANDTRLAQMQLQPERFPLLDEVAGYLIFGVGDLDAGRAEVDALFADMNAIYADLDSPRWTPEGFALARPADPAPWRPILARWQALQTGSPDDPAVRLGLAFTRLMMGEDAQALPEWQALHAARPDSALIGGALAATQAILGDPGAGRDSLLAQLDSGDVGARILAARTLLSADFVYLLDDSQLDRVLGVVEVDPAAWELLAVNDRWPEVRARAALLTGRNRPEEAAATLLAIPKIERGPDDLISLALIRLMQADPDGARAALVPAIDPDARAPNVWLHPDRWEANAAIAIDDLLAGGIAAQRGQLDEAVAAYRQAVAAGSTWAGRALLGESLRAAGRADEADALAASLAADWSAVTGAAAPPEMRSLLALDPASPYASGLTVTVDDSAPALTIRFDAASHPGALAVREWRIVAASPDTAIRYAEVRLPAVWVPDDLTRAGTTVALDGGMAWVTGALTRVTATLDLPADLGELTPVRVFVQPAYDNRVVYPGASADVVVRRPANAAIPAEAQSLEVRFAEGIRLHAALIERAGDAVTATLYWEADGPPGRDYQVFVHALDAAGGSLAQADSAPLDGRYPTGQWLPATVIADPHRFTLPEGAGAWRLYVGLYSLPDGARLPVEAAPAGSEILDNGVIVPAP